MGAIPVKKQLAVLLLSLLVLVAFSGSVIADCMPDTVETEHSDCHEAMAADCPHHAASDACLDALDDCDALGQAVIPGERKQDTDPDTQAVFRYTLLEPPPRPAARPITLSPIQPSIPSPQTYLLCCRFLE